MIDNIFLQKGIKINDHSLSSIEKEVLFNRILDSYTSEYPKTERKRRFLRRYRISLAAASVAALITIGAIFMNREHPTIEPEQNTLIGDIMPSSNVQIITKESVVEIEQNAQIEMNANGKLVVRDETNKEVLSQIDLSKEMNLIVVPYGKRTSLALSDGSKVWLNSGSQMEFPTQFSEKSREITVRGEMYIEVANDKSRSFIVHTSKFNVSVHGTAFNISDYEDAEKSVVLVEGSIEFISDYGNLTMERGEIVAIDRKADQIRYESVNTDEYTSWKEGKLIFRNASISQVLEKVGRYYNIEFKGNHNMLLNKTCSGKLCLTDNIDDVMAVISKLFNTTYRKNENQIIITLPLI